MFASRYLGRRRLLRATRRAPAQQIPLAKENVPQVILGTRDLLG